MHRFSLLRNVLFAVIGFYIMHSLSSCGTTKGMILVRGPFDTAKLSVINPVEPIIRKGDIISIIVYSDNPEATKIYNQSLSGNSSGASAGTQLVAGSSGAPGYQVDVDGNIVFQGLGKIKWKV